MSPLPNIVSKIFYHAGFAFVKGKVVKFTRFGGGDKLPFSFLWERYKTMDLWTILLLLLEAALALFLLWREGLLDQLRTTLLCLLLILLAFALRWWVLDYETLDYQNFLAKWAAFYRQNGGLKALDTPVGNYNIPYLYLLAIFSYLPIRDLYLIKLTSILFDVLLAWASLRLLRRLSDSPLRLLGLFFAVLYWPTVFLNGAVWGQCDSIYVALALLGLAFALEDRPALSMVMWALSFGFKLQAVFLLPVCAVLWMYKKYDWKHFLVFPLTYVLLVLPAVIAGRPFLDTLTLYAGQTGSIGDGLNYNSPSVFAIFTRVQDPATASTLGILAAFLLMANVLILCWANRDRLSDKAVLLAALLLAAGIPFLLPHMHDRYFFGADILSLVAAFAVPLLIPAALLCEFASLLGYHAYLRMRYLLTMNYGAGALIAALALTLGCLLWCFRTSDAPGKKQPARKKS